MLHNVLHKAAPAASKQGRILYIPRGDHYDDLVYEMPYDFWVLADLQDLTVRHARAANTYVIGAASIPVQGYDLILNNSLTSVGRCEYLSKVLHVPVMNIVHETGVHIDPQEKQAIRTVLGRTNSYAVTGHIAAEFGLTQIRNYPPATWVQNPARSGNVAVTGNFKGSGALVGLLPELNVSYTPFRTLIQELSNYSACFVTQLHEEIPFLAAVARISGCRIVTWAGHGMGEYCNHPDDYLCMSLEEMKKLAVSKIEPMESLVQQDPGYGIHKTVEQAAKGIYVD